MEQARRGGLGLIMALGLGLAAASAEGEDLGEAWRIALAVDQQLQASRNQSLAAGWDLAAARSRQYPQLKTFNTPAFLTNPLFPSTAGAGGSGSSGSGSSSSGAGSQKMFFFSAVTATQPLYTGGQVSNTIRAGQAQVNAARADEARTALDLMLDVSFAYLGVLRTNRALQVVQSNVDNLSSQARDVGNLVREGRSIKNDLLATQVALANARQNEVRARNDLDNARAAYNRYLGRPLDLVVPLDELAPPPPTGSGAEKMLAKTAGPPTDPVMGDKGQLNSLIDHALRARPELAGLSEQARALAFQAVAERGATKPQASFVVANIYQNSQVIATPDFGAAAFILSWTMFDGGAARRRSMAIKERENATLHQRSDLASRIALQVRQAWLAVQEAKLRVDVNRASVYQAEENLRVTKSRYLERRAINTEVLDAENLRVQSYNNYYNSVYDVVQADLRLRHDVGDLINSPPAPKNR